MSARYPSLRRATLAVLIVMLAASCIQLRKGSEPLAYSYQDVSCSPVGVGGQALSIETINFDLPALHPARKEIITTLVESQCFHPIPASEASMSDETSPSTLVREFESNDNDSLRLVIVFEAFPWGKHDSDYVESMPFTYAIARFSQIALTRSLGVVPRYQPIERFLTFELWQGGTLVEEYAYRSEFHEILGLAGLLLYPFEDSSALPEDLKALTRQFLLDAQSSPLLEVALERPNVIE